MRPSRCKCASSVNQTLCKNATAAKTTCRMPLGHPYSWVLASGGSTSCMGTTPGPLPQSAEPTKRSHPLVGWLRRRMGSRGCTSMITFAFSTIFSVLAYLVVPVDPTHRLSTAPSLMNFSVKLKIELRARAVFVLVVSKMSLGLYHRHCRQVKFHDLYFFLFTLGTHDG